MLVSMAELVGLHVSQSFKCSASNNSMVRLDKVLNRNFIDRFKGECIRKSTLDLERVAIFSAMCKKTMSSVCGTKSIIHGLCMLRKRREIEVMEFATKKARQNKITGIQRLDRKTGAGQKFYSQFLEQHGLSENSSLEEIEEACRTAIVFVNGDGFVESVSPNIHNRNFQIEVFVRVSDEQLFFVSNLKGLCRVDKISVTR